MLHCLFVVSITFGCANDALEAKALNNKKIMQSVAERAKKEERGILFFLFGVGSLNGHI
jgi:hypothetical protein